MNKVEFIEGLRRALEMKTAPQTVRENTDYYSQYIEDEMRKGRSEQEVVEELGDPWVIAKTIIDMQGTQENVESVHYDSPYPRRKRHRNTENSARIFMIDTWWKRLLLMVCIIGVLFIVFAIITGIISLIAPIVIPILCVAIIIRIFSNRR